jgi:3-hydroxyacyl-CoA dehydrogenase
VVRPKYNAALRLLDEGLATAKDMDVTCRLGLGYRMADRAGRARRLANHYDVTAALFEVYGTPAYAPARRAVVAKQRAKQSWGRRDASTRRCARSRFLDAAAGADGLAAAGGGRCRGA